MSRVRLAPIAYALRPDLPTHVHTHVQVQPEPTPQREAAKAVLQVAHELRKAGLPPT